MTSWVGVRSPEFGAYPVDLQFLIDSHVGPSWVVPAIVNRSGWLVAAEVEMETAFDRTTEIIHACTDENGEVLGKWVSDALFAMHCGLPRELSIEPPDELDSSIDALYWDFLGRCDIAHLQLLEEKEQAIASAVALLESRRREVNDTVETVLSGLYARRRREQDNRNLGAAIDARIAEIEHKQADTEVWHRRRLSELSSELEEFDAQVMASLQNHGRLTKLYTIRWTANPSRTRRLKREDLTGYARLMFVRDFAWDRSAYFTPDLVGRSRNSRIKDVLQQPTSIKKRALATTRGIETEQEVNPGRAEKPLRLTRKQLDDAQLSALRMKIGYTERELQLLREVEEQNRRRKEEQAIAAATVESQATIGNEVSYDEEGQA